MNDSFFNRSGTLQNMMNLAQDMKTFQHSGQDSKSRFGALSNIVKVVLSMFG